MMSHLLSAILMVASFSFAYGVDCPWDDVGLTLWSSLNADPNTVVTIDTGVLYDQSSTDEYIGINVVDGGKLVFKPDVTDGLNIKTHYIIVKNGGRMDVGSEEDECRYTGKLTIQLIGDRDTINNLPEFGDKVIGVEEGGNLNIWGPEKVSWTRLNAPLPEIADEGILYSQQVTQDDDSQGLVVYRFDPTLSSYTDEDVDQTIFKFKMDSVRKFNDSVDGLIAYFDETPTDYVVVASIRKSLLAEVENEEKNYQLLYDAIADFLGVDVEDTVISQLQFYDGYVMIKKKGDPEKMIEQTSKYRTNSVDQVSEAVLFDGDRKYYAFSYTRNPNYAQSYTHVEVTLREYSEPTIELSEDISSWELGSRLLISSTGNYEETEFATITELVDSTHVKIDLTARFNHLCETYKGVPMCAEVALVDRNVLVEGVTLGDDQHGGNIKCLKDFASCNFAHFELNLMGSHFPLGRYPIHFHLAEDVTGKAVVDSLSIHNSYARCVVVHFTHNLLVKNNVCFDCLGHGYFLEDGGEVGNTFINNFATLQRKAGLPNKADLVPTDKNPSGFFLTNPDNEFEGNVAVASEGYGFHFAFPKFPMGPSASRTDLAEGQALQTNLKLFTKNTAHSNAKIGVLIGNYLNDDGEVTWGEDYTPRVTATDDASDLALLELSCVTAYSNGEANVEITAGKLSLNNFLIAKSIKGIDLSRSVRNEVYEQSIEDSVILGDRENGQAEGDSSDNETRVGLEFTGPIRLSRVYFDDFYTSVNYQSGALGFAGENPEPITGNLMGDDIFFGFTDPDDGNRVIGPDTNDDKEGNDVESFVDANGFVTDSNPGTTVLRNTPFQVTDNCVNKWDIYAICDEEYATVETNTKADIFRVHGGTQETIALEKSTAFNVLVNNQDYVYLVRYESFNFGSAVNLKTYSANQGKTFVMGFCVPSGDDVEMKIQYSKTDVFTSENSFSELVASSGNTFFHDKDIGVVFVNVAGQESGSSDTYCVDDYDKTGKCRTLLIKKKSGTNEINDCIDDAISTHLTTQTKKQVRVPMKKSKMILTRTEKMLKKLIQKLEDRQSNYAERIAQRKLRLRRNAATSGTLPAYTGDLPASIGACDDSSKK